MRLRLVHPDIELHIAADGGEPWSKARAVNRCAARLTADVIVVHDADCLVPLLALRWAVQEAEAAAWAVPFYTVYRLDRATTADALALPPAVDVKPLPLALCDPHRPPYAAVPGGGIFAVRRDAWETVGGFDERFEGWGYEDAALGWALDTLAGTHKIIDAPLWHLWHPAAQRRREAVADNHALEIEYRRARGNKRAMRSLVGRRSDPAGAKVEVPH